MRRSRGGTRKAVGAFAVAVFTMAMMSFMGVAATASPLPCVLNVGTLIATCNITYVTQPADAAANSTITSETGNPAGAPVKVKVTNLDGPQSGVQVTLTCDTPCGTISGNTS